MNYYYDLPIDVINHIESYLIIKPNEIVNFINNPPKNIQKMLTPLIENTEYNRKLYKMTREEIDEYNNEFDAINKNFIKFSVEFGIKSQKYVGCRKALKYGLISSIKDSFNLKEIIPSCDHQREFITHDKKNIIISCPYNYNENYTDEEHFKYNFKRYPNYLYNKNCFTYILVLE